MAFLDDSHPRLEEFHAYLEPFSLDAARGVRGLFARNHDHDWQQPRWVRCIGNRRERLFVHAVGERRKRRRRVGIPGTIYERDRWQSVWLRLWAR